MFQKAERYLAKLNQKKGSEVGKIRSALIYQTNVLNERAYPTTIVLPISTLSNQKLFELDIEV
ncbi:type II toxin-antitoxin system PemK/MazF family toxin [Sulfurimonas sp.]